VLLEILGITSPVKFLRTNTPIPQGSDLQASGTVNSGIAKQQVR
jgi:hypothetical protein